MASVISFPFKLENGSFVKLDQGTDAYKAKQISGFMKTDLGERPLFEEFGINDPTFDRLDTEGFVSRFQQYYQSTDVKLTNIEISELGGSVVEINIEFE